MHDLVGSVRLEAAGRKAVDPDIQVHNVGNLGKQGSLQDRDQVRQDGIRVAEVEDSHRARCSAVQEEAELVLMPASNRLLVHLANAHDVTSQ